MVLTGVKFICAGTEVIWYWEKSVYLCWNRDEMVLTGVSLSVPEQR